jgi:cell division protein DivIC
MKFKGFKKNRWFKVLMSTYVLIVIGFAVWMIFFDTNSYFIHKELNEDIQALEENKEFYKKEIEKDKVFLDKMKDSNEIEKYAREKYYLKKEGEAIFIIENEDSLQ